MPTTRLQMKPVNFAGSAAIVAAGMLGLCIAVPAFAQMAGEAEARVAKECARIGDPSARLQCYDDIFRVDGTTGQDPAVPDTSASEIVRAPSAPGGAAVNAVPAGGNEAVTGFGAESVKREDRFLTEAEKGTGVDEIRTQILAVQMREPGKYQVTVEGGAVWAFSDAVPKTFRAPRKGALVAIKRASLGSFLMVVDGQAAVRVRRTK